MRIKAWNRSIYVPLNLLKDLWDFQTIKDFKNAEMNAKIDLRKKHEF